MRWSVMLLCLASTCALAQEGTLQADFRRESERVSDACGRFSVKAVPGCGIALFTDHPLHIAAGSMPPQNGFSLGAAFVTAKNTENWRLSWDVDAVGSFSGSWRAGGYMKLVHTPREPVRVVNPVVLQPGETQKIPVAKPQINLVHPYTVFNLYAQTISLNKLNFFGLGNDSALAGASVFGMGAGSSSDQKQPEPLEAGSAVSAVLVRGDMDIAATCTVTYIDPERLLACGHPLLQFGSVDLPMTKANVLATLPSPLNAFKIVNTTEPVGAFVQDRHTGIMGLLNKEPDMIPVTLSIRSGSATKEIHYEVLNNPKLSPVAMMATVFNALHGINDYGEETTYRLKGVISVKGYPDVTLQNMFAPTDAGQPAAFLAALSLGDRFGRIYDNPFDVPAVKAVKLDFDLVKERRQARLESARTDLSEARPGDEITVETVLAPYRGERIVRQIPIKIPTSASKGPLRILVSDGDTLDRMRRGMPMMARKLDLASTIALLNKEHSNNRVYVSLLEADPEAMVADKVMHDIYYGLQPPPNRGPIPLVSTGQRIGTPYINVPAEKVVAIVLTDSPDRNSAFKAPDQASQRIAGHILEFLSWEVQKGRMPANLLPLQSGVGNIANAVLFGLEEGNFEGLTSYTEVIQDGMIRLLKSGKLTCASATAFSLSPEMLTEVNANMASYRDRIVLRPQEISNHPEIIRRLGVIAMNGMDPYSLMNLRTSS